VRWPASTAGGRREATRGGGTAACQERRGALRHQEGREAMGNGSLRSNAPLVALGAVLEGSGKRRERGSGESGVQCAGRGYSANEREIHCNRGRLGRLRRTTGRTGRWRAAGNGGSLGCEWRRARANRRIYSAENGRKQWARGRIAHLLGAAGRAGCWKAVGSGGQSPGSGNGPGHRAPENGKGEL
jgi:hypothetical protein